MAYEVVGCWLTGASPPWLLVGQRCALPVVGSHGLGFVGVANIGGTKLTGCWLLVFMGGVLTLKNSHLHFCEIHLKYLMI